MITFMKNGGKKIVSEDNEAFIKLITTDGWIAEAAEEPKKKEVKNGKSSTTGN